MNRFGLVLVLLLCAFGAQARVAGVPTSAGTTAPTCPNPTADGSIITAPSSCALVNSLGTWTFATSPSQGTNYEVWLNGSPIEYNHDGEAFTPPGNNSSHMTAAQMELNQSGRLFVSFNASTGCTSAYTIPSSGSVWYAEVSGLLSIGRPWFAQVGSPTATVTAAPFTYTGGAWSTLLEAFYASPNSGAIGIPALPAGVPFYISGGGSGASYGGPSGTTTTAAAGAKVFCGFFITQGASGFKGIFDVSADSNSIIGDASQPLTIGYFGGIQYAGPFFGINLEPGATNFAATNVVLVGDDDCIHGATGPATLTNVGVHDCGLGGGTGPGFNHNVYFEGVNSPAGKTDNHLSEVTWTGGYNLNVHGDGNRDNGDVFKDRTAVSAYLNGIAGGNLADTPGGITGTQAERWVWDFPCGGVHTIGHWTAEIAPNIPDNGTALLVLGDEIQPSTNPQLRTGNCQVQFIGGDVLSGQLNKIQNIGFNPAAWGVNTTTSYVSDGTVWVPVTAITGSGTNYTITIATSTLSAGAGQNFFTIGDQVTGGTISSGGNVITGISPFDPTQGRFSAGQGVTASCIPTGTTVTSYTSTSITLSQNATSTCTSFQFTIVTSLVADHMLLINDACTTPGLSEPALGFGYQVSSTILIQNSAIINCAGTLQVGDSSVNNGDSLATICTTHGNACYADRAAALTAGVLIANDVDQWGNTCTVPNCPWPYLPPHPVENFSPSGTRFVDRLLPLSPLPAMVNDNIRLASNDNWRGKVLVVLRAP